MNCTVYEMQNTKRMDRTTEGGNSWLLNLSKVDIKKSAMTTTVAAKVALFGTPDPFAVSRPNIPGLRGSSALTR